MNLRLFSAIALTFFLMVILCLTGKNGFADEGNFAFVNVTFSRDLAISLRLYSSYEKFVKPAGEKFYMVVPLQDKKNFEQRFAKALENGEINSLPIFITNESVYSLCGDRIAEKAFNIMGWMHQKIVKMCFYRTQMADNYMTIDSDTYFTRPFNVSYMFEQGAAKTYSPSKFGTDNIESFKVKEPKLVEPFLKIKKVLEDNSDEWNNFNSSFGMWSSDFLERLSQIVEKKYGYDFADLIIKAPYENQWYGNFVYMKHKEDFFPVNDIFAVIDQEKIECNARKCIPTEGYEWQYGISYRRSSKKYQNPCGWFKTLAKSYSRKINRLKYQVIDFFNK